MLKNFIALSYIVFFVAGIVLGSSFRKNTIQADVPVDIVKTVAHVTVDDDNFEYIWSDAESDVAYYRYVGERDLVQIGDEVHLYDDTTGTVESVSINGFTVKFDSYIPMGYSGSAILTESGDQIGYLSAEFENNIVYCIWT